MPPASRIGDMHVCPMVTPGTPPIPHVGGPIIMGSPNVVTGMIPQARVGDQCVCVGPPDVITKGSLSVTVNGKPAARIGDLTAHGGSITVGLPTVIIGDAAGGGGGGGGGSGPTGGEEAVALTTDIAKGWVDFKYLNLPFQRETLVAAARTGAPFCEACAKLAADKAAHAA